ncbi:MAG: GIY-YIG nuclease family protein [Bacteroidota bacterium]
MHRPKTIQLFLPDGNARSVRIAEITSRTVQAIQVPRTKLSLAAERAETAQVGVYFLLGEDEDTGKPLVYVGEAEDCLKRLGQHHRSKDFWQRAVVVVSKTSALTKAHVKYLEGYCYEQIQAAGRYALVNAATPTKSFLPEPAVADVLDTFDTMQILLSTLGFPLFEPLASKSPETHLYHCTGRGASARGEYTEDGLVVLAGSTAAADEVPSASASVRGLRQRLRDESVLEVTPEGPHRFTRDHAFASPSAAAGAVLGRTANGWVEWKDAAGRTLDEIERA